MIDKTGKIVTQMYEGEEDRNAFPSVTGYLYQFDLVLLHILTSGGTEDPFNEEFDIDVNFRFEIEYLEDYHRSYTYNEILWLQLAQIKHHLKNAGPSVYSEAIYKLYLGYLNFLSIKSDDINFKCKLFYHDKSYTERSKEKILKDILEVALDDVLKKISKKKKSNSDLSDEERLIEEFHDEVCSAKFNKDICSLQWCKDRESVIEEVQELLDLRYGNKFQYLGEARRDLLYNGAFSKLINYWQLEKHENKHTRIEISIDLFDKYFDSISYEYNFFDEDLEKLFIEIIWDLQGNIEEELSEEFFTKEKQDTKIEYHMLFDKLRLFFNNKMKNVDYRYSFLNTICIDDRLPKKDDYFAISSTVEEKELFLKNKYYITSYLKRISKYLYYFKKIMCNIDDLDDFIKPNEFNWELSFPNSEKSMLLPESGVIHSRRAFKNVFKRLKMSNKLPNLLHFDKINDKGCSGLSRHKRDYKIDKIIHDEQGFFIDYPEDNILIVECLECLDENECIYIDDINYIFKRGCKYNEDD